MAQPGDVLKTWVLRYWNVRTHALQFITEEDTIIANKETTAISTVFRGKQ
jgi:hypothetical protein